jgi:hypothetical protein
MKDFLVALCFFALALALLAIALFFGIKALHAQPCFPDNCIADTTIWVDSTHCVELQLKVSWQNDTLLYAIPKIQELGLRTINVKTDTVTGHSTISWFDAIARLTAEQKEIEP